MDEISETNMQNDNSKIVKIILISAIIIIILIIIALFISKFIESNTNKNNTVNPSGNTNNNPNPAPANTNPSSFDSCLNQVEMSSECNLMFTSPDIEKRCSENINLKDECFYRAAVINLRPDFCDKIINKNTMDKCKGNTVMMPGA